MTEPGWPLLRVDGRAGVAVPSDDRGLAYGDGVFETLLLDRGRPLWWSQHLERMHLGAAALGLPAPNPRVWRDDLDALGAELGAYPARAVLRLTLTAGSSGRGYARPGAPAIRRLAALHPAPEALEGAWQDGIAARWCALRLAEQPRLAGFKHLNRLEQVLARAEWSDPAIAEGLLCDAGGRVVGATAANLVMVRAGSLLTPPVDRCGVAGVCRRWLLEHAGLQVLPLTAAEVEDADELFLCNSVRGILPLVRLGERRWQVGPYTRAVQRALIAAEPVFDATASERR